MTLSFLEHSFSKFITCILACMEIKKFDESIFSRCKTYRDIGDKYSSGQVTIVGGSKLFHGAPLLALKAASRMVGMTYFSSPLEDKGVAEKIKASLSSFVWVERTELDSYIEKSDAVLIGPGLMRSHIKERDFVCDSEGGETRKISMDLFKKFPEKSWVVDGGTLQVVEVRSIPQHAVVTPNRKEFEMMFGEKQEEDFFLRCKQVYDLAKKYKLTILTKDTVSLATDGEEIWSIEGGNEGLVKGGVGDVIAGLTVGFLAKNDPVFSVCAASFLVKRAAERLATKVGYMFNADDLVDEIAKVFKEVE